MPPPLSSSTSDSRTASFYAPSSIASPAISATPAPDTSALDPSSCSNSRWKVATPFSPCPVAPGFSTSTRTASISPRSPTRALEFAAGFASEQCPEGIVAIARQHPPHSRPGENSAPSSIRAVHPLALTPRKALIHPESGNVLLVQTDHNAYTSATKMSRKQQMAEEMVELAGAEEQELAAEMAAQFMAESLPEATYGAPRARIRSLGVHRLRSRSPRRRHSLHPRAAPERGRLLSRHRSVLPASRTPQFLLVGGAVDLALRPRSLSAGFIYTFLLLPGGPALPVHPQDHRRRGRQRHHSLPRIRRRRRRTTPQTLRPRAQEATPQVREQGAPYPPLTHQLHSHKHNLI